RAKRAAWGHGWLFVPQPRRRRRFPASPPDLRTFAEGGAMPSDPISMKTACIENLESRRLLASFDVALDPGVLHQEWTGFGAAPSAWRNGGAYNDPAYFNAVASDAGMTAVRIPVWYAFEEHNDNADPDVMNWDGFNIGSLNPTLKFAQEMQKRGADTFLASVWTPPWWMKATSAHP